MIHVSYPFATLGSRYCLLQAQHWPTFVCIFKVLLLKYEAAALNGARVKLETKNRLPAQRPNVFVVAFDLRH